MPRHPAPDLTDNLSIRIPKDTKDKLTNAAQALGIEASDLVRLILQHVQLDVATRPKVLKAHKTPPRQKP